MEKFKLGFMQGRLVNTEKKGRIQYFPAKNWKKEIQIAHKIGLDCMEWTIDYDNIKKNPIYNGKIEPVKQILRKNKIKVSSITLDWFMQKPFFKEYGNKKKILIDDLIKIIINGKKIGINKLIIPLVDNSSIKNLNEEQILIKELKIISKKFPLIYFLFESDFKPQRLLSFIKKFKSRNFGINYDTGNSAGLNYNFDKEKIYFKFVKNIHIKDRLKYSTTVRLGNGNWKYKKFFSFIRKKYSGNFILQTARSAQGNHIKEILLNKNFFEKNYLL